jgi:transposase-like protein
MKPIAEYKLKAIANLLTPDLGREPAQEEVKRALATLRHTKAVPVRDIAQELSVHVETLKFWIRQAGIKPTRKGGPSGREFCYDMQDILTLVDQRIDRKE